MKCISLNSNLLHFLVTDLLTGCILAVIQRACDSKPFGRGGVRYQTNNCFVIRQRFAFPVGADEREKPVLHFIPFARARRKMTDTDWHLQRIGQSLQFAFPQTQPVAIAAAAICCDHQPFGTRIQLLSLRLPPAKDRCYRKLASVVICTYYHMTPVAGQIVDSVGVGARYFRIGEIMPLHTRRTRFAVPCAPVILIVPYEFFLFGVHRDHRMAGFDRCQNPPIDMLELRIAIGVLISFFPFSIRLQTVLHIMQ